MSETLNKTGNLSLFRDARISMSTASGSVRPVGFSNTVRDFVQSNLGTNPSAEEIVAAQAHADQVGWSSIQVTGGTFFDMFQQKGRDSWAENQILCDAFPGVKKTMLVRGDFLMGYERRGQDFIDVMMLEFAKMGVNVVSNFHGMDDTRMMRGVADAVKRARAQGHDIYAQGGLVIEDNPNATLEMCLGVAARNERNGHKDIYIKCANGKLSPDFTFELVSALKKEFDQDVYIHTHNTYGLAYPIYLAAIEAGVDNIDVLPPYFAEGAAQPNAVRMLELMQAHPSQSVRDRAPKLNMDAMAADEDAGLDLRFRYRQHELKYNPVLLAAMYEAGVAGGASATLRAMPNLEANLKAVLDTDDWDQMQLAIYGRQNALWPQMGYPVQVTPYAKNMTDQAAISLVTSPREVRVGGLTKGNQEYLAGKYGYVSPKTDPELRALALQQQGMATEVAFVQADGVKQGINYFRDKLEEGGMDQPSTREILSAGTAVSDAKGVKYVQDQRAGLLKPQAAPELPSYCIPKDKLMHGRSVICQADVVEALGGIANLEAFAILVLEAEKQGYYKTEIDTPHIKAEENADASKRATAEFYEDIYTEWAEGARAGVQEFMASIPERFKKAGFHFAHANFAMQQAEHILKEVCAFKGVRNTGLIPKINAMNVYNTLPIVPEMAAPEAS